MPTRENLRMRGMRQFSATRQRLADDARTLRHASGLSQDALAAAAGVSRDWLSDLEHGRLQVVDLRRLALVFACLGQKLVVNAYPTGTGLRDAGQLRLLGRFNARLAPSWQRVAEAVMPISGDLRAWDELLIRTVRIGVEAETRPADLQAIGREMALKLRDSGADRMILLLADTHRNRDLVRVNVVPLRQTFPLDTRTTLAALATGNDPGANGLVLL
jgi:transcriptional regulator with XRE-family HTH domain